MAAKGFAALGSRIDKLTVEVVGDKQTIRLAHAAGMLGKDTVKLVPRPYNLDSTGSPMAFSNWHKKGSKDVVTLEAKYQLGRSPGVVVIHRAPRSAGPWRVAEEGVKKQSKGMSYNAGTRINKKTGKVVQKTKKSKRTTQGGSGFFTWSEYKGLFTPKIEPLMKKEIKQSFHRAITGY